ncbi:MAG: hypothetical protein J6J87_06300, partial [Oscillospiraceae bacterium]|nr:hypothetical protein [Oscillospiraceae bacterium]
MADLNPEAVEKPTRVPLSGTTGNPVTSYYSVPVPAKKDDTLPGTGAIAQCGIVTPAPADMSTNVTDRKQALLFFKAESYDLPIKLTEMTTLAVIRFEVNPTLMKHLSISRNPDGSYTLSSDALMGTKPEDKVVSDVAKLNAAAKNLVAGGTGLATDETPLVLPAADFTAVGFAIDKDISLSASPANGALHYDSADNQMYFVPGDMLADTAADTTGTMEVTIKGQKYNLNVPATENTESMVLAVGTDTTTGDPTYSYITNLIPPANIIFPVVSEMSYADKGVDLDRYSVLVFVDWDNTLLGTLVVPKYENVASIVNEYVAKNFVHEKLRTPTEAQMASTARADTYRGKYPYSSPMKEGEGTDEVDKDKDGNIMGEKFPLTNKLDYAFLRRPMERATNVDGTLTTANTWVQKLDESGNTYYDTYFPYAYGWAKCTAENYVDTWTTLGSTGELSSYQVAADGKASVTSTDANFQIADLVKGFGKDDSTVFLKAIYEPGTELMDRAYKYRLYTMPSYNKLGAGAAAEGGAYSVSLQYERSSTEAADTFVRGVARMREPYIRQQTTADLRWEENAQLGVNHDLPSASQQETEEKTKTTYTKVDVANSEVIDVQLVLSARQNKVDYFLTEGYGNDFVTGGERTVTNFSRTDKTFTSSNYTKFAKGQVDFVLDNYNYYVAGESEVRDPSSYYFGPVRFEDKEGSQGFILYATLNNLLQRATIYNAQIAAGGGTATTEERSEYNKYVSPANLNDANIKYVEIINGEVVYSAADDMNIADLRTKVREAAAAAEALKNSANASDYWDADLECARLTYHQLQLFIMGKGLLSQADADKVTISWCHLHASCAAVGSSKPKNWKELMAAAQDPDRYSEIGLLTAAEAEDLFRLRQTAAGGKFTLPSDFQNAVVDAVASLNLTHSDLSWENVQYAILHPLKNILTGAALPISPDPVEAATYWWYDGAESNTVNNWTQLLSAARDAYIPVTLPDGSSSTRTGKLTPISDAFTAAQSGTTRAWVSATENLMTDYDGLSDTPALTGSYDSFLSGLTDALRDGCTTWGEVQFHLLNKRRPTTNVDLEEIEGYWWHYGARKVTDTETLIQAAKDYQEGVNTNNDILKASWERFGEADLYRADYHLHFRSSFQGAQYADSAAKTFADFKADVLAYVALAGARSNDWAHLQYYLIHGSLPATNPDMNRDAAYYWWQDGAAAQGDTVTLNQPRPENRANALAAALSKAAFRYAYNGNTNAFEHIDQSVLTLGRLIADYDDSKTFADQAKVTVDTAFITAVTDLLDEKITVSGIAVSPVPESLPSFTWEEIQGKLLGAKMPSEADGGAWWKSDDKNPASEATPAEDFATLVGLIGAVAEAARDGGDTATAVSNLKAFFTVDLARKLGLKNSKVTGDVTAAELNAITWATLKYSNAQCWGAGGTGTFNITWQQLQAIILQSGKSIVNPSVAANLIKLRKVPVPAWVTAGASYSLRAEMLQGADVEVDPDTGLITTTTPDTITELPGGLVQVQRTI